jgi:hypothetical protein
MNLNDKHFFICFSSEKKEEKNMSKEWTKREKSQISLVEEEERMLKVGVVEVVKVRLMWLVKLQVVMYDCPIHVVWKDFALENDFVHACDFSLCPYIIKYLVSIRNCACASDVVIVCVIV